ncbi:alpha/beta hydrolase [Jatrophihabitans sp. YIM 134969]
MTATPALSALRFDEPAGVAVRGTLVLVPGRGETPAIYERFGRRLAADAYRVVVLTPPSDDVDRATAELTAALAEADPTVPRVVVGSDAGAAFAAWAAARGDLPTVDALVLAGLPVAATSPERGWDDELDARTACSAHRARIGEGRVRPAALFEPVPDTWLDAAVPARIDVPVLGLHGASDVVSPVAEARRWYAAVPRAELVTVAGGRHDALNDATHRTAAATLVLFLERLKADASLARLATTERALDGSTL